MAIRRSDVNGGKNAAQVNISALWHVVEAVWHVVMAVLLQ